MTLSEKQQLFTSLISNLIQHLNEKGYQITFGEAWRSKEMAKLYASEGKGIENSLHCLRLAIDLNLFLNGKYLTKTDDYEAAGRYWESLSSSDFKCAWGGHFGDGDHFSIEHNGVK